MEAEIKFTTGVTFNGSVYKVRVNNTELSTGFHRKQDAIVMEKWLRNNMQSICDALSLELEK